MPACNNTTLANFELPGIDHSECLLAFIYDRPSLFATCHPLTKVAWISFWQFYQRVLQLLLWGPLPRPAMVLVLRTTVPALNLFQALARKYIPPIIDLTLVECEINVPSIVRHAFATVLNHQAEVVIRNGISVLPTNAVRKVLLHEMRGKSIAE
jgi:hypothetical protein